MNLIFANMLHWVVLYKNLSFSLYKNKLLEIILAVTNISVQIVYESLIFVAIFDIF